MEIELLKITARLDSKSYKITVIKFIAIKTPKLYKINALSIWDKQITHDRVGVITQSHFHNHFNGHSGSIDFEIYCLPPDKDKLMKQLNETLMAKFLKIKEEVYAAENELTNLKFVEKDETKPLELPKNLKL